MGKNIKEFTEYMLEDFEELELDESLRKKDLGYKCSVSNAIKLVVIGSVLGLKTTYQIHLWATSDDNAEFLKEHFGIIVPSYYWLLSLLRFVKPESLNQCMQKFAMKFLEPDSTIAIDGKAVRSNGGDGRV